MAKVASGRRGAMLLWAVCSLFTLSTALVLVTSGIIRATQAQRSNEQRLVALGIAERELERLKAVRFSALPADGDRPASWSGLDVLPGARARLALAAGPFPGMKEIRVRIEWQEPRGPQRQVELTALRSPRGG